MGTRPSSHLSDPELSRRSRPEQTGWTPKGNVERLEMFFFETTTGKS